MAQITYETHPTGESSTKFGKCEVCNEHASEVHYLRTYQNGDRYHGDLRPQTVFGHAVCLTEVSESAGLLPAEKRIE